MGRINPSRLPVRAMIERRESELGPNDVWITRTRTFPGLRCRVTDAQLVERTDQQGRVLAELQRTLYCVAGSDLRPGDRVRVPGLNPLRVEAASDQIDGAYRKALTIEERG